MHWRVASSLYIPVEQEFTQVKAASLVKPLATPTSMHSAASQHLDVAVAKYWRGEDAHAETHAPSYMLKYPKFATAKQSASVTQLRLLAREKVPGFEQTVTQALATRLVQSEELQVVVQSLIPEVVSSVYIPAAMQSEAVQQIRPIWG